MSGDLYEDKRLIEASPAHQLLTFAAYRESLAARIAAGEWLGVEARFAGQPVALALAETPPGGAELISLFVHEGFRKMGIGARILRRLCEELKAAGRGQLATVYRSDLAAGEAWDRTLSAVGFSAPVVESLCCIGRIDHAGGDGLLALPQRGAFTVVPWSEGRKTANLEADWIPASLHPRLWEPDCEPRTSMALLYQGQFAGWLITHRLPPDLLRCTSCYIDPSLRSGGMLCLLTNLIRRQREIFPGSRVIWTIPVEHRLMVRFARTRLQPAGLELKEFHRRDLDLSAAS